MPNQKITYRWLGLIIAVMVILLWITNTFFLMLSSIELHNPLTYVFILIQMHLYTGLFITAHDAMHGSILPGSKTTNQIIGQICTACYALFPLKKLQQKHHQHHQFVHTNKDPDYYEGNFFVWYFSFIKQYISWWQIVFMAVMYNLLKWYIAEINLILFWVVPSVLSTLQLFYFGTYIPHKGTHQNRYHSKSLSKNHFLAFFSCYFFGYHYEHHHSPATPWWLLWKKKEEQTVIL